MHPMAFLPQYSLHTLHKSVATKHHYHHHNHHHHRHVHHLPSSASSPHTPQHIRVGSLAAPAHETRFTVARRGHLFEFEGHHHAKATPIASVAAPRPAPGATIPNTVHAIASMLGRHRRCQLVEAMHKAEALAHDVPGAHQPPFSRAPSKSQTVPLPQTSHFSPFGKTSATQDAPTPPAPMGDVASVAELYAPGSPKVVSNNSSVSELYKPPAAQQSRASVSLLYAPPTTVAEASSKDEAVAENSPSSVSTLYAPPPTHAAATDDAVAPSSAREPPVRTGTKSSVSLLYAPPPAQAAAKTEAVRPRVEQERSATAASNSSVSVLYAPPQARDVSVTKTASDTEERVDVAPGATPFLTGDVATVAELYGPSASSKKMGMQSEMSDSSDGASAPGSSSAVADLYEPPMSHDLDVAQTEGKNEGIVGKAFQNVKGKVAEGIDAVKRLVSGSREDTDPVTETVTAVTGIEEAVEKLAISTSPEKSVAEHVKKPPSQGDIINTTVAQLYQPPPVSPEPPVSPSSSKSAKTGNNTSVSMLYQPPAAA